MILPASLRDHALFDLAVLPRFAAITVDDLLPTIDKFTSWAAQEIDSLSRVQDPDWINFVAAVDDVSELTDRAAGIIAYLAEVTDRLDLKEVNQEAQEKFDRLNLYINQHEGLFKQYQQVLKTHPHKAHQLASTMGAFRLGGLDLDPEARKELTSVIVELGKLTNQFAQNLTESTGSFTYCTDEKLSGLPDWLLAEAYSTDHSCWIFSLQDPVYDAIMKYADARAVRQIFYEARATRAPENKPLIKSILKLRRREAELLGSETYVNVALENKMAKSKDEILNFLCELAAEAKPRAIQDLDDLKAHAAKLGIDQLEAWDIPYVSAKLRDETYNLNPHELRKYFKVDRVLDTMLTLAYRLYEVSLVEQVPGSFQTWDKSVRLFELTKDRELVGYLYMDLYSREGKSGGAWMNDFSSRRVRSNGVRAYPVVHLNCNFAPTEDMDHEETLDVLHEFGHALHHLLTRVDDYDASGINGVEWDAVEAPSQLMEFFCWNEGFLGEVTEYKLPIEVQDRLIESRKFNAGIYLLTKVESSLTDIAIHVSDRSPLEVADRVKEHVTDFMPKSYVSVPLTSFHHIFAVGSDESYAAGFYSYQWAEAMSAEIYHEMMREGDFYYANFGKRFLDLVLSRGGSEPFADLMLSYLGRPATLRPMLRYRGLHK